METLDCTKFHIQMKNSHSGGKNSHSAEKIHIQKTQILDPECGITHAECGKKKHCFTHTDITAVVQPSASKHDSNAFELRVTELNTLNP